MHKITIPFSLGTWDGLCNFRAVSTYSGASSIVFLPSISVLARTSTIKYFGQNPWADLTSVAGDATRHQLGLGANVADLRFKTKPHRWSYPSSLFPHPRYSFA